MSTIQIKKVNASQARVIVATGKHTTVKVKVKRKIDLTQVSSTKNVRRANETRRRQQRLQAGPFAALAKLALCFLLCLGGGNLFAQDVSEVRYQSTNALHVRTTYEASTVNVWIVRGKDCVVVSSLTIDTTGQVVRTAQRITETPTSEENTFIFTGLVKSYLGK